MSDDVSPDAVRRGYESAALVGDDRALTVSASLIDDDLTTEEDDLRSWMLEEWARTHGLEAADPVRLRAVMDAVRHGMQGARRPAAGRVSHEDRSGAGRTGPSDLAAELISLREPRLVQAYVADIGRQLQHRPGRLREFLAEDLAQALQGLHATPEQEIDIVLGAMQTFDEPWVPALVKRAATYLVGAAEELDAGLLVTLGNAAQVLVHESTAQLEALWLSHTVLAHVVRGWSSGRLESSDLVRRLGRRTAGNMASTLGTLAQESDVPTSLSDEVIRDIKLISASLTPRLERALAEDIAAALGLHVEDPSATLAAAFDIGFTPSAWRDEPPLYAAWHMCVSAVATLALEPEVVPSRFFNIGVSLAREPDEDVEELGQVVVNALGLLWAGRQARSWMDLVEMDALDLAVNFVASLRAHTATRPGLGREALLQVDAFVRAVATSGANARLRAEALRIQAAVARDLRDDEPGAARLDLEVFVHSFEDVIAAVTDRRMPDDDASQLSWTASLLQYIFDVRFGVDVTELGELVRRAVDGAQHPEEFVPGVYSKYLPGGPLVPSGILGSPEQALARWSDLEAQFLKPDATIGWVLAI